MNRWHGPVPEDVFYPWNGGFAALEISSTDFHMPDWCFPVCRIGAFSAPEYPVLNAELESILEMYDCSKDELLSLRHWVAEGNSPFNNPDRILNEAGLPCDFIAASRILDEAFLDINKGGDLR